MRQLRHVPEFLLCIFCGIALGTLVAAIHFHIYDSSLPELLNNPKGLYWAARQLPIWTIPFGLGIGLMTYLLRVRKKLQKIVNSLITGSSLRKQKTILWIGVLAIVGMCLFPPWVRVTRISGATVREGYGYHCIFTPPPRYARSWSPYLDRSRLIIQCLAVGLLTATGIVTVKKTKAN